jgi:hypothetical protein
MRNPEILRTKFNSQNLVSAEKENLCNPVNITFCPVLIRE